MTERASAWKTARKIAWRETRASTGRFVFVVLAVAAGVAALTGVRGFANSFHTMLEKDARTFMAADLTIRTFSLPTPAQAAFMDSLAARGIQRTQITETVTMAALSADSMPILISVKAVDPAFYPFYGEVKLSPAMSLGTALTPDSVVVADGVLLRLNAKIGDSIRLGGQPFRIAAEITNEPDRMTGSLNAGPRVMISRAGLARTGLLIAGSRAAERYMFKVPAAVNVKALGAELKRSFREGLIADYTEAHPLISQGLKQSTTFLSLVSLVALVIGALGVATAIQAHLQQRMDSIAVMKCLGAKSSQVLRIYLIQTVGLGLVGSALGIALGSVVQMAFPVFLQKYFHLDAAPGFDLISALQGLLVGVLTVLLFTVPPLMSIRTIRPALIFRREMAAPRSGFAVWAKRMTGSLLTAVLILAFVGLIAAWLSNDARTGRYFAFAVAAGMAALSVVAWAMLRGLRWVSRRLPRRSGPVLRQGIANLYRPGNHAGAAVMALGVGVMFTVTVWIVQRGLLKDIVRTAPPGMPNVYLLDVTAANRQAVYTLLRSQPGVEGAPELLGAVAARMQAIDGVTVDREKMRGFTRRYAGTVSVSTIDRVPDFSQVVSGEWWKPDFQAQGKDDIPLAVAETAAKALNLHIGSAIDWSTPQRTFHSHVAAIHKSEQVRITARIEFFFPPGTLDGLPVIYYGGARVKSEAVPALQKTLYEKFPAVTVINMADVLDIIQSVVDQISLVIRFISAFSILAGAVILASSVAGTRFRRIREVVILKTLGASRNRIAKIFSIEFFVIGGVAGLMGGALAAGFAWAALNRLLDAVTAPDILPVFVAVGGTAVLAVATGWLASYHTLGQKPLEILRDE
jgi:putative ABC transport system permease protein